MQTENPDQYSAPEADTAAAVNAGFEAQSSAPTPGDVLQTERLRQNLSEKDVSDQLHITMHYVRAIESNRFDKLPGAVFAKGYIKSYAALLGLEPNEVTALFDGIHSDQQEMKEEATRRHLARRRSDRNKPWVYASAACFILGFVGLWAYNYFSESEPAPQVAPQNLAPAPSTIASRPIAQTPPPATVAEMPVPVPAAATTQAAPVPQQVDVQPVVARNIAASDSRPTLATALSALAAGQPTLETTLAANDASSPAGEALPVQDPADHVFEVVAEGDDVLRINFSGESWVEVNDSQSKQIYRDIREAGDVLEITGDAPFSILLGDAPFTQMFLNGNEINVSDNIRIDNSARLTVGL